MGFDQRDQVSAFLQPSPRERRAWPTAKFVLLALVFTVVPGLIAYMLGAFAGARLLVGLGITDLPLKTAYASLFQRWEYRDPLGVVALELPDVGLAIACCGGLLLALKLAYRRPMLSWLTSVARFRWRPLVWGFVLYGALWIAGLALQGALSRDGYQPNLVWMKQSPPHVALFLIILLLVDLIRAAGEEIIFRGWMMRQVLAVVPSVLTALVFSAAAFALYHRQIEPFRMTQLIVAGLAFGWVAIRTGGLEWGIGLHTSWNLAIELIMDRNSTTVPRDGDVAAALVEISRITASEWLVLIAMPILAIALTELVLRMRRLRALVGLSSTAAAARLPSA